MANPVVLAQSRRASVCAPAGYGKTHLIGNALLAGADERQLILTHTHAGVHALRTRLMLLGVPKHRYRIDTIAGWSLQYAQAFPRTTGYTKPRQAFQEDWPTIYTGVASLLQTSPAKMAVISTYGGIYVDEYQDCSLPQHALIQALAELIPCRILGDPLQAIFNFAEPTVDWENVTATFPPLPPLSHPHRWDHDPSFAAWIQGARVACENNQTINLRQGLPKAVRVVQFGNGLERNRAILTAVTNKRAHGRTVVITQWPHQCHDLARRLPGVIVLEPVDGNDFTIAATQLSTPNNADRVTNLLAFAAACFTGIPQQQQDRLARAAQGTIRVRNNALDEQIAALKAVIDTNDLTAMPEALTALAKMPDTRVLRPELYHELRRAFIAFREGGHETIHDALSNIRQRTRQAGRALTKQTMARTLLVKGLEFEHAIIITPEDFPTKQNMYVAITRGTRSLTIITNVGALQPPA